MKKIGGWIAGIAAILPAVAFAAPIGDPGDVNITDVGGVIGLLLRIMNLARTIFWIVAVAMVLYAAFLYLFGGANDKSVGKAKTAIWSAVIAIAIALIATSVPYLVKSFLGG